MDSKVLSVLETLEPDEIDYYFDANTWRKFANCLGLDPSLFHPSRGVDQDELHKYCNSCMVQTECLSYAILSNEDFGFWGNHSERARRLIRKKLKKSRPDLLKAGSKLASRSKKGMKGKLAKSFSDINDDAETIDEGELMDRLMPKVRQLLLLLASHRGDMDTSELMLAINVSAEAFQQRFSLAQQKKWVKLDQDSVKLTRAGREILLDSGVSVKIRELKRRQTTSPQEVVMTNQSDEWLSDLDIEILNCLAGGEIEDAANASGALAGKIGVRTGSNFSNHLKRLDDQGLIRRRINGKRTNHLAITSAGNRVLDRLGTPMPSGSNGTKPSEAASTVPASDEAEEWSSEVEEGLLEQLEGFIDRLRRVLAENSRLRQIREGLQEQYDALKIDRAEDECRIEELTAELEAIRPLAERYTQMQQLLTTPAE